METTAKRQLVGCPEYVVELHRSTRGVQQPLGIVATEPPCMLGKPVPWIPTCMSESSVFISVVMSTCRLSRLSIGVVRSSCDRYLRNYRPCARLSMRMDSMLGVQCAYHNWLKTAKCSPRTGRGCSKDPKEACMRRQPCTFRAPASPLMAHSTDSIGRMPAAATPSQQQWRAASAGPSPVDVEIGGVETGHPAGVRRPPLVARLHRR